MSDGTLIHLRLDGTRLEEPATFQPRLVKGNKTGRGVVLGDKAVVFKNHTAWNPPPALTLTELLEAPTPPPPQRLGKRLIICGDDEPVAIRHDEYDREAISDETEAVLTLQEEIALLRNDEDAEGYEGKRSAVVFLAAGVMIGIAVLGIIALAGRVL